QHLAQEERTEPAGPLSDHLPESNLHVRSVERLHTAESLHVLGGFFDERIDHIVDSNNPKHSPLIVDHWNGQEVVLGDESSGLLTIDVRGYGQRRSPGAYIEHVIIAVC